MRTSNYTEIQANTSHELRTKIGMDKIRNLKPQDTRTMYSVHVPSQRAVFYCATLARATRRVCQLEEEWPGIVTEVKRPVKS